MPLCLRVSRQDDGAPACYPSSPVKKENQSSSHHSKTNIHMETNKDQRDRQNERETTPGLNTFNPARAPPASDPPPRAPPARAPWLVLAGTSRSQSLPGSPSPLDRIVPWRKAQISAYAGTCLLSIRWPFPPPSRAQSAGLSASCIRAHSAFTPPAFNIVLVSKPL